MSDLGGIGGALLLSDQISTNRLFDSFRRAREANNLALNDAAWRNQYNDLVNRYNALARDANRLADVQDKALAGRDRALAGQDREIAELKATNDSLAAEVKKLRLEVLSVRGQIDLMRMIEEEKTMREQQNRVK
jgi:hypothetical protein